MTETTDRGRVSVTTTEATDQPTDQADGLPLPAEREAEPFHLDRVMLRELGSCGDYIRKHRELFPPTEYPDGPVINSATCRKHATDFDWNWAIDRMLGWRGREEVERIANSRAQQYAPLGPGRFGNARRVAAAFGFVFATMPHIRHANIAHLAQRALENAERRALDDLQEAKNVIAHATEEIEQWTERKERAEAELPALRAFVETVKVRTAERRAQEKERQAAALRTQLAELERDAARLREVAREATTEPTTEPTATEETA